MQIRFRMPNAAVIRDLQVSDIHFTVLRDELQDSCEPAEIWAKCRHVDHMRRLLTSIDYGPNGHDQGHKTQVYEWPSGSVLLPRLLVDRRRTQVL